MSSSKKLNYRERSSIKYIDSEDPPFLQKIKEKLNYKPPPTIDDKFASTSGTGYVENDRDDDDILQMQKDDMPQVLVLDASKDLSEKELAEEIEKQKAAEDRQKIERREIVFKKPVKRESKQCDSNIEKRRRTEEKDTLKPDSRLLSFDGDDDD